MAQGVIKRMMGDAGLLMGAGVFVQVMNLLAYPVLTRFYSAADFGVFAAVLAMATVIGSVICLRLDMVFQLVAKTDENDLLRSAFTISLTLAGVMLCLTVLGSVWVLPWVAGSFLDRMPILVWAAMIVGLGLLIGWSALGRQIRSKSVQYRRLSVAQVMRAIVAIGMQYAVALIWPSPFGLLFGFALGLLVFNVLTLMLPSQNDQTALRPTIVSTLTRHKSLIWIDTINVLISALVLSVYPMVILFVFGENSAGYFAIASRFSFIPVEFLGAAISTVFFQRFSESIRTNATGTLQLFWGTLALGLIAGLCVAMMFWIGADWFVALLFEPEWAPTSALILALIPTMVVRFYMGCIGSAPLAMKRPGLLFIWNTAQIFIVGGCVGVTKIYGLPLRDFLLTSGLILFVASLVYIGYVATLLHQSVAAKGEVHAV